MDYMRQLLVLCGVGARGLGRRRRVDGTAVTIEIRVAIHNREPIATKTRQRTRAADAGLGVAFGYPGCR